MLSRLNNTSSLSLAGIKFILLGTLILIFPKFLSLFVALACISLGIWMFVARTRLKERGVDKFFDIGKNNQIKVNFKQEEEKKAS